MVRSNLSEAERVNRLEPPDGPVSIVLDTDTYNEIDDQFAVAYALLSEELSVEALTAAPFYHEMNSKSESPEEGMEKSYEEILRLLDLMDVDPEGFVYRGATEFMPDAESPVENPATDAIVEAAHRDRDGPLYVVAIGAPTNVSSAIAKDPSIIDEIVVVWLGGNPSYWPSTREFNLMQNPPASRVLFDSGVPLVQVPCQNVAEHVRTTIPELEANLEGTNDLGEFLLRRFSEYRGDSYDLRVWTKEIWDVAPIAYLVDPGWVPSNLAHSPHLSDDLRWSHDESRHLMREAIDVDRDRIFDDFFSKLIAMDDR